MGCGDIQIKCAAAYGKSPKITKRSLALLWIISTTIAETTQIRQVLRMNLNKFNEVKALSAFGHLLRYVNYFFFEGVLN